MRAHLPRGACALLALLLALPLAGCASWFMNGAVPHDGIPTTYVARYHAPSCVLLGTGQSVAGPPDLGWFLVEHAEGPRLLELDAHGRGSAITNGWQDEGARYFFTSVGSQGWVYAFPKTEALAPARHVYAGAGFAVIEREDILLPLGQPVASCEMVER